MAAGGRFLRSSRGQIHQAIIHSVGRTGASEFKLRQSRINVALHPAVGTAAHGIGVARAFQVHPVAGAYAGLAMGLNGLITALGLPLLAHFI